MTDIIDWDSLKAPSEPIDESCPNCQSTNSQVQERETETHGYVRSNIHCPDCGWGWSHVRRGHDEYHRRIVTSQLETFGRLYFGEMSEEEQEMFESLGESLEELAEHYGIEYPLKTFDDD